MHTFPSSLPSIRTSQLLVSNAVRTMEGFCCDIPTEWKAGWPGSSWLADPRQCIQTRAPIVANCVQGPLPMDTWAVKQGTRVMGQTASSTTKTPHLPLLNKSVILGLAEEEWITAKNPQGKAPQLPCWGQLQQGKRQFQQWNIAHNPPTQRNPATQKNCKTEHGTI